LLSLSKKTFKNVLIFWLKSLNFWSQMKILVKNRHLKKCLLKIEIFDQKLNLSLIIKFMVKNRKFGQKQSLSSIIKFLDKNWKFGQKFKIWSKIENASKSVNCGKIKLRKNKNFWTFFKNFYYRSIRQFCYPYQKTFKNVLIFQIFVLQNFQIFKSFKVYLLCLKYKYFCQNMGNLNVRKSGSRHIPVYPENFLNLFIRHAF